MTMPKREFDAQEIAAIVEPLARQGLEAARKQELPELAEACHWALEALESGSAEALVGALVAIGYRSRDIEVRRLNKVVEFYRQRDARRGKAGRKSKEPYQLLADRVARLVRNGMQLEAAKSRAASDAGVVRSTIEEALRRQRLITDPLGAYFEDLVDRAIRDRRRRVRK